MRMKARRIYLIPSAVVKMVVSCDTCDDLNAMGFCSLGDLGYVIGIHRRRFLCGLVYEQICVVIVADGYGDDLHCAMLEGNAGEKTKRWAEAHVNVY